VGENHRPGAGASDLNIVASQGRHWKLLTAVITFALSLRYSSRLWNSRRERLAPLQSTILAPSAHLKIFLNIPRRIEPILIRIKEIFRDSYTIRPSNSMHGKDSRPACPANKFQYGSRR
jgi:hypothetical protein